MGGTTYTRNDFRQRSCLRPGISPSSKSLPLAEISVEAQEKGTSRHPDRVESGEELQQGEAEKLAEAALQQINAKKYETELMASGVKTVYKYGLAFSGKKVEVTTS